MRKTAFFATLCLALSTAAFAAPPASTPAMAPPPATTPAMDKPMDKPATSTTTKKVHHHRRHHHKKTMKPMATPTPTPSR